MKRTLNGNTTTWYAYDGEKPIWEGGATYASNIYGIGIDEIATRFKPNTTHFFYQDWLGSVSFVTNLSSIIEKYRYDAFGTPTIRNGSGAILTESGIGNRFMFTGREGRRRTCASTNSGPAPIIRQSAAS